MAQDFRGILPLSSKSSKRGDKGFRPSSGKRKGRQLQHAVGRSEPPRRDLIDKTLRGWTCGDG